MAKKREIVFANDEIYHVFNRSIAKEQIFSTRSIRHLFEIIDYYRVPQSLRFSQYKLLKDKAKEIYDYTMHQKAPFVEIYCFAIMPNHYHLLLKQLEDDGIMQFVSTIQNSFAKYFNIRDDRSGAVFQNPFKGKWIESDEQFMHVSRYIHLNPVTAYKITMEQLASYPYTSFMEYQNQRGFAWVETKKLLDMFTSTGDYKRFVADQVDYQRTLADLKDVIME